MGLDVIAWLQVLAAFPKPTIWKNAYGIQRGWTTEMKWPLPTDFNFNDTVEAATEAWQFAHGLTADGVVGPKTWEAAGVVPAVPAASLPIVKGCDTSVIQGKLPIDRMVQEGIVFGWARCKVGNNAGVDTRFAETIRAYRGAGIFGGGYCFPFPLPHLDPVAQADTFLLALMLDGDVVGTMKGDLPIAVDAEWPPPEEWTKWGCTANQIVDFLLAQMQRIESQTGIRPILYSYPYFIQAISKAKNFAQLLRYKLWLAGGPDYISGRGQWPDLANYRMQSVPGWGNDWLFNQWDGNGGRTLPGGVDADFNIFRYNFAALEQLCQSVTEGVEYAPSVPTLPDTTLMLHATSDLIVEDMVHAYRQARANQFILQPT
jgi:GH25 family lysozyme M1 (1,4-beta-N-acetylmuramidase)